MPRPERALDPTAGPVQSLAADLREIRRRAGSPGYRELSRIAGYSSTTLADAAGGRRLPPLPVLRAYVSACGADPAEWEERWRTVAAQLAQDDAAAEATPGDPAPYLGLATFQPADADRFFGRERLVEELTGRLSGGGFLAVVGPSGCGKSSLLRAGLLPALTGTAPDRDHLLITPGAQPLREHADVLAGPPPLVLVDQFEEVFTICRDEGQRTGFLDALLAAAAVPGTTVVVALRADFYGRCAYHPGLVAALRDGTALVGPMSDEELGRVVTGPAGVVGLSVERALVTKVVADAGGQAGALPLLSHALLETWRLRQGRLLTLAGYEAAGGVAGAIAKTAERVYDGLSAAERRIARHVLTRLTALGEGTEDTRRRVDRSDLDLDGADRVVDRLAAARLLVTGETTVEIAHEALISAWPRLRGWLTEDRDALRTHRQLTETAGIWQRLGREPGALYRGARLALAREWADRTGNRAAMTTVERAFLDASLASELAERAATERRSRLLRRLSAALAALLAVAVTVGTMAVWQWREAVGQRQQATSRQLAAQALSVAATDAAQAMRLSLAAYRASPTMEARGALLSLASAPAYTGRLSNGSGLVKDVAFSPDGAVLAAAGQDGRVTLWDVGRRRERVVLTGHRAAARAVAYHPAGTLLASGGLGGEVFLWDSRRGVSVGRLSGHKGAVDGVAFSPDGTVLASIGEDRCTRLWRVPGGAPLGALCGHGGAASDVAFSPDGARLVSAGDDGTAVVWDVARKTRVLTLAAGTDALYAAVFSLDGRLVAAAGEDRDITVWDAHTGQRRTVLVGHTAAVRGLAFAPDGTTLVSAGYDEVAGVWDVPRGRQLARLAGNTSQLYGVAVSPDGRMIAAASRDRTVLLWDRTRLPLLGHSGEVSDLSVSADGRTVASDGLDRNGTSGSDGAAVLWDAGSRRPRAVLPDRNAVPPDRNAVPDQHGPWPDRQPVVTRSRKAVVLWDPSTAAPIRSYPVRAGATLTAALQPGGSLLAAGGTGQALRVWDARSGAVVAAVDQPQDIQRVDFSADGRTLISASRDGTVVVWDTGHRSIRRVLHTGVAATDAAVSPDGTLVAVGGPRGEIALWDTARTAQISTFTGHTGAVDALAFSPDGRLLASGSQDRTVVLWDMADHRIWATLVGHRSGISSAAWNSTGDTLYTGSADQLVIPWTVRPADAVAGICRDLRDDFPGAAPPGDAACRAPDDRP